MAQTKVMRADDISASFNSVDERKYWRASIAGTRVNPEVHFNSRASMVQVVYRITTSDFTLTFNRTNAAFGDFLASAYRSLEQVLVALKAAGLEFEVAPDDNPTFRLEYCPVGKWTVVYLSQAGASWLDADATALKVPVRNNAEIADKPVDAP